MKNFSRNKFQIIVVDNTYIDLEASSGRSYKTIATKFRGRDEGLAHVNTYAHEINDPACMPEMGGMMGVKNLAVIFQVSIEHFKRNIMPNLEFLRDYAGIPVTNVSSAYAAAEHYHQEVNQARCQRINKTYTDCSSGSLY